MDHNAPTIRSIDDIGGWREPATNGHDTRKDPQQPSIYVFITCTTYKSISSFIFEQEGKTIKSCPKKPSFNIYFEFKHFLINRHLINWYITTSKLQSCHIWSFLSSPQTTIPPSDQPELPPTNLAALRRKTSSGRIYWETAPYQQKSPQLVLQEGTPKRAGTRFESQELPTATCLYTAVA